MGSKWKSPSNKGAFVVLIGPDGVGKTSIASEMLELYEGCTGYVHFRPPVWSALAPTPTSDATSPTAKARGTGSTSAGVARLIWSAAVFWVGYLVRVRPAVRRGCLVVGDRWAYGYVLQPLALGYYGPVALARWVLSILPRPDLLVALEAAGETVLERKQELTPQEVSSELEQVGSIRWPKPVRFESSGEARETALIIMRALGR